MLLIFDLDDTLIDTSGSITPIKMKRALDKIVESGAEVGDLHQAYQELLKIDQRAASSLDAFAKFVAFYKLEPSFVEIALLEMGALLPDEFNVKTLDGVHPLLVALVEEGHQLALVTFGIEAYQMQKLEKAGIDRALFRKIVITQDRDKGPAYRNLISELEVTFEDTVVCGDRIETDLLPAKAFGCSTIHMVWGRGGRLGLGAQSLVDYQVSSWIGVKKIIEQIQKKKGNR